LFLHEALYKVGRDKFNQKNSNLIRHINAQLLSTDQELSALDSWYFFGELKVTKAPTKMGPTITYDAADRLFKISTHLGERSYFDLKDSVELRVSYSFPLMEKFLADGKAKAAEYERLEEKYQSFFAIGNKALNKRNDYYEKNKALIRGYTNFTYDQDMSPYLSPRIRQFKIQDWRYPVKTLGEMERIRKEAPAVNGNHIGPSEMTAWYALGKDYDIIQVKVVMLVNSKKVEEISMEYNLNEVDSYSKIKFYYTFTQDPRPHLK
jgi:hypothetical protein